KDVVEFAWSLPIEYKREGKTGKKVLRDVLYRYVPKEMMERPKKGFSIPIDKWLLKPELRAWAEALIDRTTLQQQGVLDADVVWKIWEDFTERGVWRIQIWFILMFQQWQETEFR
ncbi:MAG: asparagine synthase C-terminal domain-containing protein, partial [Kineothrix sp.]|nr:asparagine synthase C-terminal domain-containing protein [Kineothrix sp.]